MVLPADRWAVDSPTGLLNFEGWLLDAEEEGTAPTSIPDEFYDLIVKAGHELSSTSEATFIKSVKAELVKTGPGGEPTPCQDADA